MLNLDEFGRELENIGVSFFSGVPCSYLSPLINYTINNHKFIMSNNEGDAVAIASGITLSNLTTKKYFGAVLMQNSGLSNALSPLTSLNNTFHIPILGFVSLRGQRDENNKNTDEPQHELMGVITDKLLGISQIQYAYLSDDIKIASKQLEDARKYLEKGKTFFFIVKKNTFNQEQLKIELNPEISLPITIAGENKTQQYFMSRIDALKIIQNLGNAYNALILATTGKTGRELYELGDYSNQLYMVGSMGCVSALSLGLSLFVKNKVIAIDGDGALLMRLGALSTNAYYSYLFKKTNFCHVLLDNESHDSTGGQFNLSSIVNFPKIAKYTSYLNIRIVNSEFELQEALMDYLTKEYIGAYFIYLKINKGSKEKLGRPKVTPAEVALRFSDYINMRENDEI